MSQSSTDPTSPVEDAPQYLIDAAQPEPAADKARPAGMVVWLLVLVGLMAAAGLVTSALLWQKLNNIQEELARRSLDSGSQATGSPHAGPAGRRNYPRTGRASGAAGHPHQRSQPAAHPARRADAEPVTFAR